MNRPTTRKATQEAARQRAREELEEDVICPIGLEIMESEVTYPCGHSMCEDCWRKQTKCPQCRAETDANWTPEPNLSLRGKIEKVHRTADCGRGPFHLGELLNHRKVCIECKDVQLGQKNKEIDAYVRNMEKMERRADHQTEIVHVLRDTLKRYESYFEVTPPSSPDGRDTMEEVNEVYEPSFEARIRTAAARRGTDSPPPLSI